MYCIIKIENHPDRGLDEVIGPISDYDKAKKLADQLENEPANFNKPYNHRFFRFYVRALEQPPEEYQ